MTSVIEKFRKMTDLHRLRGSVKRDRTPGAFADLAERYISLGRVRDARGVTIRGLATFPTSERLRSISAYLRKDSLKEEISRLKKRIGESPNPAVFNSLAQCYLELGDHDRTLAICDECASRYPLNENPYLIAGEVHTEKFFLHLTANDGIEGEALLRRALRLNAQNLKPRLLLAQIYYAIGALSHLDQELAEIRRLSPDFEDLMIFRATVQEPEESEQTGPDMPGPSVVERIRAIEARERFANPPTQFPASALTDPLNIQRTEVRLNEEQISRSVGELAQKRGVTNVAAVSPEGTVLAVAGNSTVLGVDDFPVLAAEILDTASDATRRMEFGALDWCTIEGDFGGIAINQLKGVSFAASFERPLKSGTARRLIGEFAARGFTADGEG